MGELKRAVGRLMTAVDLYSNQITKGLSIIGGGWELDWLVETKHPPKVFIVFAFKFFVIKAL